MFIKMGCCNWFINKGTLIHTIANYTVAKAVVMVNDNVVSAQNKVAFMTCSDVKAFNGATTEVPNFEYLNNDWYWLK